MDLIFPSRFPAGDDGDFFVFIFEQAEHPLVDVFAAGEDVAAQLAFHAEAEVVGGAHGELVVVVDAHVAAVKTELIKNDVTEHDHEVDAIPAQAAGGVGDAQRNACVTILAVDVGDRGDADWDAFVLGGNQKIHACGVRIGDVGARADLFHDHLQRVAGVTIVELTKFFIEIPLLEHVCVLDLWFGQNDFFTRKHSSHLVLFLLI